MNSDQEPRKSSRAFSDAMKEISGMSVSEQESLRKSLKEAIDEGRVTFTANAKGGGTLRIAGGEKINIEDIDEASFYEGLQGQANQKSR